MKSRLSCALKKEPGPLKLLFLPNASEGAACNYRPRDVNNKELVFQPFLPPLTLFNLNGSTINIQHHEHI